MLKKTRAILLTILGLSFFIITPFFILYSIGYRFDFEKKKIINTGGLYLKISPANVDIFINKKLKKKTGFFQNTILIQNLLPKNYEILIKKENYHPWEKNLEIKEGKVTKAENIILFKKNPVFEISQEDIKKIFFTQEISSLKSLNEKNILSNFPGLITHTIFENNIIWLQATGFLYKSDTSGNIIEIFNLKPLKINKNKNYEILIEEKIIFIKENKRLFFLNPKNKTFEETHHRAKKIKLSPDKKKILLLDDFEIWILDISSDYAKEIFIARFSDQINNIFWLNNNYLIFNTKNKIKISEIDDRDKINIIDLAEFENPEIFWNKNNKKLYILSNQRLFVSEKLIP